MQGLLVLLSVNTYLQPAVYGVTNSNPKIGDKVEEVYAFIAHNYSPGDDIYLFGFSRGAYTARMVAMFIGEIGVLDRNDMDHFASIFVNFQRRGTEKDAKERDVIESNLAPWLDPKSKGKMRVDSDRDGFTIKCVGVWDTVGALGLPDEIIIKNPQNILFGFTDPGLLGAHVQYAFQALALDERRKDFNCNKFVRTTAGKKKGQVLKQCWFTGTVGGGYLNHDLSDISLFWMAANVESMLALDVKYLENHLEPVARWGEQEPHNSVSGIFVIAKTIQRDIPMKPDEKTCESIHPSALARISSYPKLKIAVENHPELIWDLLALEKQLKAYWETKYDPESSRAREYTTKMVKRQKSVGSRISRFLSTWTLTNVDSRGDGKKSTLEQGGAGALKTGLPVIETPSPIS
ncbi:hypothetical protein AGABI2DRAFT_61172 [Agaricus bisporus var. bisporus H97]|uniref:hypothetical protein n=1 Tax=Agaricus bisporus var. bisporus (strain H97 / ATCC MYA-4626 / FGSC 10389) TaxID=936046 RepID=UPI00029F65F8|nr:hypothetical protein AGABI2DRAFT_61172 [Agaricus bisporus var. bisporus H97]EKV51324.1 hypothetical protein AGABI2DRAFT_61172 [Agaricus bisporus var. bisporus H97]